MISYTLQQQKKKTGSPRLAMLFLLNPQVLPRAPKPRPATVSRATSCSYGRARPGMVWVLKDGWDS